MRRCGGLAVSGEQPDLLLNSLALLTLRGSRSPSGSTKSASRCGYPLAPARPRLLVSSRPAGPAAERCGDAGAQEGPFSGCLLLCRRRLWTEEFFLKLH